MGGAWIEAAIGATRQPRNLAKRLLGDRIVALLEHEGGHAEQAELACGMAEIVELLLHRVADEDQGLHLGDLGLALGMGDDLADLGVAAAAVDPLHQRGRAARPATPSARPGIRPGRGNRPAARRARRSPPPRGTCPPAAGRPYPTAAAGSWWRRGRRSAVRAGRLRSPAPGPSPGQGRHRSRRATTTSPAYGRARTASAAGGCGHWPWSWRLDRRQYRRP